MLLAMRQLKPNLEEPNSNDDGEGPSLVIGSDQGNAQSNLNHLDLSSGIGSSG